MSVVNLNTGFTPVPGFNFMLRVEMAFDVPVKSVRAFSKNFEYEYIQEGGLNDYVHMRRKPISQPFTFEVERYAATDQYYDPLQNGTELMLPLLLMVSSQQGEFWGYSRRTFAFTGCTVIGKEYGQLDAERGALLTEVIKIAYRQVAVIDIPETIVAEKNNYSKNFGKSTLTLEQMKEEQYGRQKDDAESTSRITKKEDESEEAENTKDKKEEPHYYGKEVLEGFANNAKDNSRYYKVGYGDFSGDKSADINTYLAGEIGATEAATTGSEDVSGTEERYYGKEIAEQYANNAKDNSRDAWPETESYYGKEVLDQYAKNAKTTSRQYKLNYGDFSGDKSADINTYLDGEIGAAEAAPPSTEEGNETEERYYGKEIAEQYANNAKDNSRTWPKDESYYGKEIAENYESNAKDNSRSWPEDESYYGKDIAETIGNSAIDNSRTWPDTESYYGKEVMHNYESSANTKERSWPNMESYYGKEIAQGYQSSAKTSVRQWPKTESYYGQDTLQRLAKNAKNNVRQWPPTESAFGVNQTKKKGKK